MLLCSSAALTPHSPSCPACLGPATPHPFSPHKALAVFLAIRSSAASSLRFYKFLQYQQIKADLSSFSLFLVSLPVDLS